eukprot:scaffold2320_cov183-Pinguiococcus_pyrenoidosus.AAC.3
MERKRAQDVELDPKPLHPTKAEVLVGSLLDLHHQLLSCVFHSGSFRDVRKRDLSLPCLRKP